MRLVRLTALAVIAFALSGSPLAQSAGAAGPVPRIELPIERPSSDMAIRLI